MRTRAFLAVAFLSTMCPASGWNDFALDIGEGYQIVRANHLDVVLVRNGEIVLDGSNYTTLGPITGYFQDRTHIFVRLAGTKPRNLFAGDTFIEVDETRLSYFIVTKGSDTNSGPLTLAEFAARPELAGAAEVKWITPRNPNILLPLSGAALFIAYSIPILVVGKPLVGVPLLLALLLVLYATYRLLRAGTHRLYRLLRPRPAA